MANQLRRSGVFNLGSLGGDATAIVDADFDSVVLLLDGDGTNGQTTFTDLSSSPHTIITNGDTEVSTSVHKFGGGSIKFDGTGDYLTGQTTSTDFAFGPDDFTIESWVYFTGFDVFGNSIVDTRQSNGNVGILLEASAAISGQYYFRAYNPTSSHFITSSQALSTNTWYHVALVRNGNNYQIFVDGVSTASVSNSVSLTGEDLTIGASYDYRNNSGTAQFTGYLDDLRITKGVARYSSSFTPPTSALPVESDTVFLVRGDNGGTDVSDEGNNLSANNMSTVSSTVYSSPQTVFDFNGSTSYLISSGNPYSNLDDGDPWTIEFWAKLDANAANTAYGMFGISDHTTGASGITIRYYNGWNWWVDGFNNQQTHQTTATTGTWYHIALVYNGSGNSRLFVDGVPSTNALGRTCVLGTEELTLGRSYEAYNGEYFNGQLADVRITKGVVRYPQRLPPISALPTTGTVAGATRPTRKWGGLVGRSLIVSELPHSPNAAIFRGTTNQGSQALSINGTAPTFSGSDRSRYHTPLYTGYYSYSPATAATSWTAFYDWEMNATNYPYLASYGTTAGAVRRFYTQGTDIRVYRGGGSTFPIMLSGLTDGQRYRAAFRWDGTNLKSYLVSGTAEITALPTASATTTEDFDLDGNTHSIGVNSANNVPAEDLGSPLYAYAFYNSALTDAQMVDVFNVLNGHVI